MNKKQEEMLNQLQESFLRTKNQKYSLEYKQKIINFHYETGLSLIAIAKMLKVSSSMLYSWRLQYPKDTANFAQVKIIEDSKLNSELELIIPGGFILKGLSIKELMQLLPRLCSVVQQ